MNWFAPKYRRDPNEKVDTLYYGVGSGNTTVTRIRKKSRDGDKMEISQSVGPGLERGQGGRIGVLVIGGMETSLDEMEYILEAKRQKKFIPRRNGSEIADMCRLVLERRNEAIKHYRKNPSEAPKKKTVRLHLPVGYRYVGTKEPGLQILARI
ncbi:MAG: hypothetical protein J3T61_00850 [Candidatus Brocadiales bacterium]|nr:hypothetical protein [Candidatus Bathyanammoxibius sp.]